MSKKLTVFTLVTLVVIVAAAVVANLRAPQSAREKPLVFPELKQRIEEISHIRIQSFDDTLNLSRKDNVWGIDEFDGYPALPEKVKSTVLGVADLKLNAPKTALERLYPRLGVEGPVTDESPSKLLTLKNAQQQDVVRVIVGKPRRSSAAQNIPGLYIREPDKEQSYLVDGMLDISAKKTEWIERALLDIPKEEIQQVRVAHADGDSYTLFKKEKGQDSFKLQDLPQGKKPAPDILLNRYAAILADVQISSVRKKGFSNVTEKIAVAITTFDGLQVDMQAFLVEGRPYASFVFSLDTRRADDDDTAIKTADLQQYVDNMNSKLDNWVFEFQGFKYDIVKNRSDMIVRDDNQSFSTLE